MLAKLPQFQRTYDDLFDREHFSCYWYQMKRRFYWRRSSK